MIVTHTQQFEDDLIRIEDHIFATTNDARVVETFLGDLDNTVIWIKTNVTTPKIDDTGERSWPFYRDHKGELRCRLKYLYVESENQIFLKRIIDNREQNLEIYPVHKLNTYSGDEE